ncbi:MAG: hypothetical protein EOM52_05435, partial [Clostridia bacterium]|nr:hypothetical protein [Clostridia bacterium]
INLDVRVIATTNRDLRKAVANHLFREDLFYRLNVFPLRWLPLRARAGDILPLAEHLLRRHAMDQKLVLPDLVTTACQKLLASQFPLSRRGLMICRRSRGCPGAMFNSSASWGVAAMDSSVSTVFVRTKPYSRFRMVHSCSFTRSNLSSPGHSSSGI